MISCDFATTVWENDWRHILLTPGYLENKMMGNHCFNFKNRLLVINNVKNLSCVKEVASYFVEKGILTEIVVAREIEEDLLNFFCLKKEDFISSDGVVHEWVYYNALGPLSAIYLAKSPYLLYHTGDVWLEKPVSWVEKSIAMMENDSKIQVANLIWNGNLEEVKRESYKKTWNFFFAKEGFSDQQFLVRKDVFCKPIYSDIRSDSHHYPRGDVFEKRVFSFLKNHGYERLIARAGSYIHQNIQR